MRPTFFSTPVRYFMAVAQAGTVSQAAEQLHVAASAVSRQIARLEDTLGAALFERHQRGMALTPSGERLLAHLRAGDDEGERVVEQLRGLAGAAARRVRVACTEGFAGGFLPAAMLAFREIHPDTLFELRVAEPDEASALLSRGEVALALKYSAAPERGLQVLHAAVSPLFAVMSPEHPLARRRVVAVAEVVRYPLALGSAGMTARRLLDLSCSAQGLQYEASVVSNFSSALLPMVQGGDIVLTGYLTAAHLVGEGRVAAVPFAEAQMQQRRLQLLSLQSRAMLPPRVAAFALHLAKAIEAYGKRRIGKAVRVSGPADSPRSARPRPPASSAAAPAPTTHRAGRGSA